MKLTGIIAEYNPFHTGHMYHIRQAKLQTCADYIIAVMSPDFVQRGEPAVFDKFVRTEMALRGGADLVLELPLCYATGSAEFFAEGSIAMLDQIGADALCFGIEGSTGENDAALLRTLSGILAREPDDYRNYLQENLKRGLTFPAARTLALETYLRQNTDSVSDTGILGPESLPQIPEGFLASPNAILAIEYCKALFRRRSRITPIPIRRAGSQYNSTSLKGEYCSASALREFIKTHAPLTDAEFPGRQPGTGTDAESPGRQSGTGTGAESPGRQPGTGTGAESPGRQPGNPWQQAAGYIPEASRSLFASACRQFLSGDDLTAALAYCLLQISDYRHILDISPDLSERILNLRYACMGNTFSETVSLLKTKQLTESRVRRGLLHLILNIQTEQLEQYRSSDTVFYARVLGFRKDAGPLLHELKKRSQVPLLTKLSHAPRLLNETGMQMLTQDINASHFYRSLQVQKYKTDFKNEYQYSPVIL